MSQQNNNQQNSNRSRPNGIRGPSSALSSFLREHNIHIPNQSRRSRREREAAAAAAAAAAASAAEASSSSAQASTSQASSSTAQASTASASTSSAPEASASVGSSSQEQLVERTHRLRLGNRSLLASGSASKKRKKNGESSDDDSSDDDDDLFMPESSSRSRSNSGVSLAFCATCGRRFTRRAYQADVDQCPSCLSGESSSKKPAAKRKKVITRINKNVESKARRVATLQDVCIGIIADNIEDVESFGIISEDSLGKLSRIISKNRKMSDEISRLFMEPMTRRLNLYDCTAMTDVALLNIAQFCPRLQALHLSYCGQLNDSVIKGYGQRLHDVKSLHFSGPYLVTKEAWIKYFKQLGKRLESFELRYTSRFDLECIQALVKSCPNLTNLKFGHITTMNSSWLAAIAKLAKLTSLELAWPDSDDAIKTEHVVEYLAKAGPLLKHFSLKGGANLDDKTFTGLSHCKNLETLHIEKASNLTAKGMVTFLKQWENPGLRELDIGRCSLFDDEVITEIIQHSGESLTKLSIHSLDLVSIQGLEQLAGEKQDGCKALQEINCSFVRSIDDYVLAKMVRECSALCKIEAWGCPMLTDAVKCTEVLTINGRELLDSNA